MIESGGIGLLYVKPRGGSVKAEAMLARIRLLESTVVEMRDGVGVSLATLNNLTSAKNVSAGDRPDPIYVDKRA